MNKAEIAALLGRPLTSIEDTNFGTYLNIAEQSLEELICTTINPVEETRVFDTRKGYSTAFVDIFTDVSEVKLNDEVVDADDYSVRQWDKRSGSWYNSLVFDNKFKKDDVVEVTAEWGFTPASGDDPDIPVDLQAVIAGLFGLITKKNKSDGSISSKQVEDFRIAFNADVDLDEEFYRNYRKTIAKYSLCDIGNVQHGEVCSWKMY